MGFAQCRETAVRVFRKVQRIAQLRIALGAHGPWEAQQDKLGKGCPVLLYHHVGPFRSGTYRTLTVSPRQFERQIRWLARHGYAGIRPSQWQRWLKAGAGLPAKPVMITFDDAYADIAEFALPVLERHGFGGCVFVVSASVGGTNRWDEAEGIGNLRLLNADQIRYWADSGIEFGAHSRTHADLTRLSPQELTDEVVGSKSDLQDILGSPVASFAYPNGAHNDAVREIVRANFGLAFSTIEGVNFFNGDHHLLRRVYVGPNDPLIEFASIIRWGGRNAIRALLVTKES